MMKRIALLTNFVPPYRLKLFEALGRRVGRLKIFVSTSMEADRPWTADSGALDIVSQRNITVRGSRKHPSGFSQKLFVHIPYDTVG
jgi:hypothetical protein